MVYSQSVEICLKEVCIIKGYARIVRVILVLLLMQRL